MGPTTMARNWGKVKYERRKDTNGEKWEGTAVWPHLRRASSSSLFALLPHIPSPPHLPSISSSLWSQLPPTISNFFLYTTFPNAQNGHREAPTAAAIRVESGWYLLRPDLNELISGLGQAVLYTQVCQFQDPQCWAVIRSLGRCWMISRGRF